MSVVLPEVDDHKITRVRVLVGEDGDPSRRGNKQLVARSQCRFRCRDQQTLSRCIEEIRLSDEHLQRRPEELALWDWQCTYVEQIDDLDHDYADVVLGVAWYNIEFFENNKDAYLNPSHLKKYLQIGIHEGDIEVSHWRLCGGGKL